MNDTLSENYFSDARSLRRNSEHNEPSRPRVCEALARIREFKGGRSDWPHINRAQLVEALEDRVMDPNLIDQAGQNVCGVVAMLRAWALDSPVDYVSLALDLYTRGTGQLKGGRLGAPRWVTPSSELKSEAPPGGMNPADWLLSASIRESLNTVFNYTAGEGLFRIKAYTTPGDVENEFRRFGYSRIRNKASLVLSSHGYESLMEASQLFLQGSRVIMLVNSRLVDGLDAGVVRYPDHWVALTSAIVPVIGGGEPLLYQFSVWSWAVERSIPQLADRIALKKVIGHYFGFVAGRY